MDLQGMPIGFGMALTKSPEAMSRFGSMTESEQLAILSQAHGARSEAEMDSIVSHLLSGGLKD